MDERIKLIKALRDMGATKCEVDGVVVEFASEQIRHESQALHPKYGWLPPNLHYLADEREAGVKEPEVKVSAPPPAIRGNPDPDAYSRASDMWANYEPPSIRG